MSHTPNLALCLKCLPESPFKKKLTAEIEAIEQQRDDLLAELRNIADAKRYSKEHFDNSGDCFADWAQSRARHAIVAIESTN